MVKVPGILPGISYWHLLITGHRTRPRDPQTPLGYTISFYPSTELMAYWSSIAGKRYLARKSPAKMFNKVQKKNQLKVISQQYSMIVILSIS